MRSGYHKTAQRCAYLIGDLYTQLLQLAAHGLGHPRTQRFCVLEGSGKPPDELLLRKSSPPNKFDHVSDGLSSECPAPLKSCPPIYLRAPPSRAFLDSTVAVASPVVYRPALAERSSWYGNLCGFPYCNFPPLRDFPFSQTLLHGLPTGPIASSHPWVSSDPIFTGQTVSVYCLVPLPRSAAVE